MVKEDDINRSGVFIFADAAERHFKAQALATALPTFAGVLDTLSLAGATATYATLRSSPRRSARMWS